MTREMSTHPASTPAAGRRADCGSSGDWERHTILAASKPRLPAVDRDGRAISDEGADCPASWVVTALSVERGSSPQFAISNSLPLLLALRRYSGLRQPPSGLPAYRAFMQTKVVLVVRADLGMGRGKIAAQAAHAAVAATLANLNSQNLRAWLEDGQPKVVLRADSQDQLLAIAEEAAAAGLSVQVIRDAGRTQVEAGTSTCCAIGPAPEDTVDAITGELTLL